MERDYVRLWLRRREGKKARGHISLNDFFHYNSHEPVNVALKSAEFEKIELKLSICCLSLLKVKRRALKLLKSAHLFIPLPYIFSFKLLLLEILTCATLDQYLFRNRRENGTRKGRIHANLSRTLWRSLVTSSHFLLSSALLSVKWILFWTI